MVAVSLKKTNNSLDACHPYYHSLFHAALFSFHIFCILVPSNYLPTPLTDEEIVAAVEASIAEIGAESKKDMGQVMKLLQEKTGGKADGKKLSQEVMKRLS